MLKLYTPFQPMEPKIWPEPFDDADYGFQLKWDGTRILAHIGDDGVELYNRKGRRRTLQYPEIALALRDFSESQVILDGEIVALSRGKPSFHQVMRRDRSTDDATISYLSKLIPVTYVVFDILVLGGEDLTETAFSHRDQVLKTLLPSQDPVVVTDTFPEVGKALFSVVEDQDLEGIVAKKLDSHYTPGKKSDVWLKVKNRRNLMGIVGGYIDEGNAVRSLLLGILCQGDLTYIGRAGSGLTQEQARKLYRQLEPLKTPSCPFSGLVSSGRGEIIHWVTPQVDIPVEYMELTEEGILRHPVIKL